LGVTGAGAAAIIISTSGIKLCYAAWIQFNSEADKLRAIRVQRCTLCTDSKVVAGQIEKECVAREPTLEWYVALVKRMENYFKGFTVEYIK
jgi:ribonuclease HI